MLIDPPTQSHNSVVTAYHRELCPVGRSNHYRPTVFPTRSNSSPSHSTPTYIYIITNSGSLSSQLKVITLWVTVQFDSKTEPQQLLPCHRYTTRLSEVTASSLGPRPRDIELPVSRTLCFQPCSSSCSAVGIRAVRCFPNQLRLAMERGPCGVWVADACPIGYVPFCVAVPET